MQKLLIGTTNEAKLEHYRKYFSGSDYQIVSPKDLQIVDDPEETGLTLEENAVLKAEFYAKKSGLPTIADDAGFEIKELNNFPGVMSRRFTGYKMSDEEIITAIIDKMQNLPDGKRQARMNLVVALSVPGKGTQTASAAIEGMVPRQPLDKIQQYFPYRSLLFVTGRNKWFYDISEDEVGYRKAAVEKLKKYLTI